MPVGLVGPLGELVQAADRLNVSCRIQPGVAGVQDTVAWPGPEGTMRSHGAPGVCTAAMAPQNPPLSV